MTIVMIRDNSFVFTFFLVTALEYLDLPTRDLRERKVFRRRIHFLSRSF